MKPQIFCALAQDNTCALVSEYAVDYAACMQSVPIYINCYRHKRSCQHISSHLHLSLFIVKPLQKVTPFHIKYVHIFEPRSYLHTVLFFTNPHLSNIWHLIIHLSI